MKKFSLLSGLILLLCSAQAQQDPQYNLYQFNQMVINPAYAGSRDGLSAVLSRRQQWVGIDGAPVTNCMSLHGPILNKNLGLGLTLVSDEMGPRNVISAYGNVAYILRLSQKWKLSFGVNAGYNRYQFNFSEVKFQVGESPAELYQNQTPGTLDINSGIYLRSGSFFFGASATHLNAPNVYSYVADQGTGKFTYKIRTHIFVTAGKSFIVSKNLVFAPTMLFKQVGEVNTADINLNFFIFKKMWLGAFYRSDYGPGALLQYYITNKFRVGYSYDSGMNDARRLGGSHEVMIGFDFSQSKSRMVNPRFL